MDQKGPQHQTRNSAELMQTDCIKPLLLAGWSPSQQMFTYLCKYSLCLLFISNSLFNYSIILQTRVGLLVHVILKIISWLHISWDES